MPTFLFRHALQAVALAAAVLITSTVLSSPADAMTARTRESVLHVAAAQKGVPYRYGGTTRRGFDCSGYTRYVFARVGRHLPRTSAAQSRSVHHVRRSHRRRGDLVFFRSGGHVYHVGIYAGRGRIWHAPRPGQRVHKERLWTRHGVSYGRVR